MSEFKDILENPVWSISSGYALVVNEKAINRIDLNKKLKELGYRGEVSYSENDCEAEIDLGRGVWTPQFFYTDKDQYLKACSKAEQVITKFMYLNNVSNGELLAKQAEAFLLWSSVFKKIANHVFDERNKPKSVVFFTPDEKMPKTYHVQLSIEGFDTIQGEALDSLIDEGRIINEIVCSNDNHSTDKINILKSVISEFICNEKNPRLFIVFEFYKNLRNAFNEKYEVYLYKYGADKIILEIQSKNLDFIEKIQQTLLKSQTNALALPGTALIISVLPRLLSGNSSVIFILISWGSLFLVHRTITSTNSLHKAILNNLNTQANLFFESYSNYTINNNVSVVSESSVRVVLENSKENIRTLIKDFDKKIDSSNRITFYVCFIVGLLILFM